MGERKKLHGRLFIPVTSGQGPIISRLGANALVESATSMPSLLDTLDRFNYNASSIQSTTSSCSNEDIGPFTAAILHASLQSIIREADEAEYGLFTFVRDSANTVDGALNQGKIGRKEFRGATPLKPRRVVGTTRDEEPEVYVEAALKYIERL